MENWFIVWLTTSPVPAMIVAGLALVMLGVTLLGWAARHNRRNH